MARSDKYTQKKSPFWLIILSLLFLCIAAAACIYYYARSQIVIEAPKENLGEKIIITLPTGKNIYTFENLIVEENGKLLYKGERSTLDLTGGVVVYENWE
ncbi:hypothetical protein ACQCT6_05300 [Cytobacillus gottheilii]|uniref:Uncharacterized protein n=1 Tax=Cytobacillus gottheilii TaxID=859144 RepID=A0ABX8FG81_9BACI|nr:hypothetical protein [Cytobacillus gottheilii]QVY63036.1 hypothetical protein J1899_08335 [Cytobacillus gottheilii]